MKINLELEFEEVKVIYKYLIKGQFDEVAQLISKIEGETSKQVQASQEAKATQETEEAKPSKENEVDATEEMKTSDK